MTALFPEATERDALDFNRTPAWCVELLIPHLGQPRTILDAGCGDGAIGKVLRRAFPDACIQGYEIDPGRRALAAYSKAYDATGCIDWLDPGLGSDAADLIISNPPFGLAALGPDQT